MDERVAIFIDGGNFYHALREDFARTKLSFEKFTQKIVAGRNLLRVYYYNVLPKQQDDPEKYSTQQAFMDSLDHLPYFDVFRGKLKKSKNGEPQEEGIDVAIAVDMLEMAFVNAYDTAIIVSGDSDLWHAVEVVKRLGKHIEIVATPTNLSRLLHQLCDKVLILDENFLADCWETKGQNGAV